MPHEHQTLDWSIKPIPARIVIGVTGHRTLPQDSDLAKQIRRVRHEIESRLPRFDSTRVIYDILSPLAEGADRLVAYEILEGPEARLLAILPLPEEQYLDDFESDKSKREFLRLLNRASHKWSMPSSGRDRNEAYKDTGRYVVDHCDFLIAIWDGKPASGPGGTSEIVEYARISGRPLIWVHTEDPHLTVENTAGIDVKSFEDLDEYNSEELLPRAMLERRATDQYRLLGTQAEEAGFPLDSLRPIREHFLPHLVRADFLAEKYHQRHLWWGIRMYILGALAVMAATAHSLLLHESGLGHLLRWVVDHKALLWTEFVLLLIVGIIVWCEWRGRWHTKWVDYRFLAERFRSALFLAAAGVSVTENLPRPFISSYSSRDWMMRAFSWVWHQLPGLRDLSNADSAICEKPRLQNLKQFVISAWIEDQLRYHQEAAARNDRSHLIVTVLGLGFFGLALLAVMLHLLEGQIAIDPLRRWGLAVFLGALLTVLIHRLAAAGLLGRLEQTAIGYDPLRRWGLAIFLGALLAVLIYTLAAAGDSILSFLNISIPAAAGALAAIRSHGEYERIAERSKETVRAIEGLKAEMQHETHAEVFTRLVAEAEQTMLHENQDWRALFRSRRLEPGG